MFFIILKPQDQANFKELDQISLKQFKKWIIDKTIPELNDINEYFLGEEKYEYCAIIRDRIEQLNG